jgi:hypothetical protein
MPTNEQATNHQSSKIERSTEHKGSTEAHSPPTKHERGKTVMAPEDEGSTQPHSPPTKRERGKTVGPPEDEGSTQPHSPPTKRVKAGNVAYHRQSQRKLPPLRIVRTGEVNGQQQVNCSVMEVDQMKIVDEGVRCSDSAEENTTAQNDSVLCFHCKSPRLNVLPSPGIPLHTDTDSDPKYELSVVSESDLQLDSDMDNTVLGSDDEDQASDYQMQLLQSHREAFYKAFTPYYEVASKSSKLITDDKYRMIRDIIQTPKQKKEKPIIVKYRRIYTIVGIIDSRCLHRNNKVVTTFDQVFDVIWEAH